MTKRSEKRKKRNIKFLIVLAIIFIALILCINPRKSLARYIYNAVHNYYLSSKGFYFNCDKLGNNYSEYEIENNWSGAETYTITINLNSKKNDLVFAENDIKYNISFTNSNNIECTLNKQSGTILGSLSGGINEDYFTIDIDPAQGQILNTGEIAWIDLTITSTEPYEETLNGRLIIETGTEDITYEIVDSVNSPYIEVNITNSLNESKNITLEFDPNVILLDMTNRFSINYTNRNTEIINGYNYINNITSSVNPLETATVKFFKVDASQNYEYQMGDNKVPVVQMTY